MSTKQKPTIVYVPGAWHNHHAYDPTTALLDAAGYKTHGVDLVSPGSPPPFKTCAVVVQVGGEWCAVSLSADDDQVLRKRRTTREHSAALTSPCTTSSTNTKADDRSTLTPQGEYLYCADPHQIFYNDLSASTAAALAAQLTHHPSATFDARTTHAGWRHIPTTYVLCEKDNAIPVQGQDALVQQARGVGAEIVEVRLDASHSPMISQPEAVAAAVRRAAGEVDA
ncbi:hypothetical protein B0A49_13170 [Cryomyces minteri]|uniref:AB hydrolase-1 domain-containing protein n=1 Tax=Cryomyces minteri TaxID=331657 RepID=A0A4U0WBQ4_9PEZI|nr:hypothetical protein B0A49_13170 [Cryomyces minteri]